jgi:hypothetical protein
MVVLGPNHVVPVRYQSVRRAQAHVVQERKADRAKSKDLEQLHPCRKADEIVPALSSRLQRLPAAGRPDAKRAREPRRDPRAPMMKPAVCWNGAGRC